MAYDSQTRTITVDEGSEFILDSGHFFVDMLRKQALSSDAPEQMRSDWKILENWLGCAGRELSVQDGERIRAGWKAYFGLGLAPSRELQPLFDSVHEQYERDGVDYKSSKPPTEVMDVFDRMLAKDADIRAKKREDWDSEKKRLEPLLQGLRSGSEVSWWRRKSENFRRWLFVSAFWAVAVLLFVVIFDPFNNGDWRYMDDDEYVQMFTIMVIPFLAGVLRYLYSKWVK